MKKAKKDKKATEVHHSKLSKAAGGHLPHQSPANVESLGQRRAQRAAGALEGRQYPPGPNVPRERM